MDKIVEIARFTYPADAQPLMALLRSRSEERRVGKEGRSRRRTGGDSGKRRSPSHEDHGGRRLRPTPGRRASGTGRTSRRIRTSYPFSTKISLRETNHDPIRHHSCLFGFGDLLRIAYFLKLNKCNQWHAER